MLRWFVARMQRFSQTCQISPSSFGGFSYVSVWLVNDLGSFSHPSILPVRLGIDTMPVTEVQLSYLGSRNEMSFFHICPFFPNPPFLLTPVLTSHLIIFSFWLSRCQVRSRNTGHLSVTVLRDLGTWWPSSWCVSAFATRTWPFLQRCEADILYFKVMTCAV